jgi:cell division protein ZapA
MNEAPRPTSQQIEVQIMGQSYLLTCPSGGEAALLDAVERVDTAMCRIRDAGKVKARDRIAVLASLNLAYELSQRERELQERLAAPGQAPARGVAVGSEDDPMHDRLDELLRRIDEVLGNDGQLI